MTDCLFCQIVSGKIPAKKVYEDEHTFAFEDINPKAPTHVLVVPKKHVVGLKEATMDDAAAVGRCHLAAAEIARRRGIENGYRTVLNVGPGAGQSVFHLHVHLLGGRDLTWPPGKFVPHKSFGRTAPRVQGNFCFLGVRRSGRSQAAIAMDWKVDWKRSAPAGRPIPGKPSLSSPAKDHTYSAACSSGAPWRRRSCGRFCENAERGSTMSHPTS